MLHCLKTNLKSGIPLIGVRVSETSSQDYREGIHYMQWYASFLLVLCMNLH